MSTIAMILFMVLCVWGIFTVQERADTYGIIQAFKSLFALFMVLIGFTLIFSGYGTIFGLPIVYGCVKYFSNKI